MPNKIMDILAEIYDRVSDTSKESTRPVLMAIMKPVEKTIKEYKEEERKRQQL